MSTRKFLTAALVALALVGWGVVSARSAPQGKPNPGGGSITLRNCKIVWFDERIISSKIPGKIVSRPVKEGDTVEEGYELAVLDDAEVRIEYKMQKFLGDSELGVRNAKAKLDEYRARKDAADILIASHSISREDYRIAILQVIINEIAVEQEEEKSKVEKFKAERLEALLDDHRIKSPMRGVVQKCSKREGESIPANDLQVFRIVATDRVWVEGTMSANDLFRVRKGQSVVVRLTFEGEPGEIPAEANQQFTGNIVFLDPDVDLTSGTFWVHAEVQNLSNKEGQEILHAGLKCDMTILLGQPPAQEDRRKKGTASK